MILRPPRSTPLDTRCPYTTLFRSRHRPHARQEGHDEHGEDENSADDQRGAGEARRPTVRALLPSSSPQRDGEQDQHHDVDGRAQREHEPPAAGDPRSLVPRRVENPPATSAERPAPRPEGPPPNTPCPPRPRR